MDPFDELLRGVRASGADLRRVELSGTRRLGAEGSLVLCAPLRGSVTAAGRAVPVGETLVAREPVTVVGDAVLFVGTYQVRGKVGRRLLGVLPSVLVVPDGAGCESIRGFVDAQTSGGAQVAQDRLLDWLVVCTLRGWFDTEAAGTGWLHAMGDDTVGPVLRAMHREPERSWTLATLADQAGVSRTTLATRFAKLVGEPPLTYLTDWRMTLAADLLTESAATVAAVARQVGYADAFGFSAAFKRFHGTSPSEYRATCDPTAECVDQVCS
ncbi:AraC family transcriptional regulator [Actinokineospora diospyrosa]|uniref:AraC-type DNA-binding protein n=1 Tax=Actinokineospora diospyrosa TaxID=103728 RepID=A0ABT1I889_9PSEU|nr:AraC family transcriptional regulator [Actinokineospora diospyrosa]MCP2268843.1 AraC-type DNA-binding protein [Actinokineospora diospyrosa]